MAIVEHVLVIDEHFRIDVVQVPLEAGAVEAFAERDSLANVAKVVLVQHAVAVSVVEAFVLVEPDLGEAFVVAAHDVATMLAGHVVRVSVTIDVTHSAARHELQTTTTHPCLIMIIITTLNIHL